MRPGPPPLYRFVAARSGQSNPLAVVLLLGITIVGSGSVVALGTTAFDDTRERASLSLNEQSMSKLDSEAAVVALGSADTRRIDLGDDGDGQYSVREDGSWLRITHRNVTGSTPVRNETVYNASLGAVRYESGDDTVAYEGGGVWRTTSPGNTTMVSPPEFRYRGATLTLPVIRVVGDETAAGGGQPSAEITSASRSERVFPVDDGPTAGDEVGAPYNHTDEPYENPVMNGTVAITIHSPHYTGWAEYFRDRTQGNVSVDHGANEATVVLEGVGGELGLFETPDVSQSVSVESVRPGHSTDDFRLRLQGGGAAQLNNRYWGQKYSGPDGQFAVLINFAAGSGNACTGGSTSYDGDVRLTIYYDNQSADGGYQIYEEDFDGGTGSGPVRIYCDGSAAPSSPNLPLSASGESVHDGTVSVLAMPGSGPGGPPGGGSGPVAIIDFTSSEPINYGEMPPPSGSSAEPFRSGESGTFVRDYDPDAHPEDDNGQLSPGSSSRELQWVSNHYIGLLAPRFTLTTFQGPGGGDPDNSDVDESLSQGELRYTTATGNEFIRYLHITENEIRVSVEA